MASPFQVVSVYKFPDGPSLSNLQCRTMSTNQTPSFEVKELSENSILRKRIIQVCVLTNI